MLLRQDSRLLGAPLYPANSTPGLTREEFGLRRSLQLTMADEYLLYECNEGDTITAIANQFYGNPYMWWIIADANELVDVWVLQLNQQLKIPTKAVLSRMWGRK